MSMLWQALAIDDQYHYAWTGLGNAGGGVVRMQRFSAVQCYQQVLCREWHGGWKGHFGAWGGPGMGAGRLGHVASGRFHGCEGRS